MEKNDFQNVEFEQNTLKSAKCYYFFAKGFTYYSENDCHAARAADSGRVINRALCLS